MDFLPYAHHMHGFIAQAADPTNALPSWLAGGSLAAILSYLLYRAEKRCDDIQGRVDASEERYRQMAERYAERTFDAVTQLGRATETIQALAQRGGRNG